MATYLYTEHRYNGTTWDTLYPQTTAGQVIQSSTKVFLHPTTNTVNGKSFGTLNGTTWTPSAITLYAGDIALSSSDSTTIASAISAITTQLANAVTTTSTLTANAIVLGNGSKTVKNSSYTISNDEGDIEQASSNVIPDAVAISDYLANTYPGSTNITTVGTIATGTWHGTVVDIAYGGTGAATASGARTNLGLGTAAVLNSTSNSSDITNATSSSTTLPNVYAVQQYVAGIKIIYTVVFSQEQYASTSAPDTSIIPQGVVVYYNSGANSATGTLVPSASQVNKILLVFSGNGVYDTYDEYLCIQTGSSTYSWEKIGDTGIDLSSCVKKGTLLNGHIAIASSTDTINANKYVIVQSSAWSSVPAASKDVAIPTILGVETYVGNELSTYTGSSTITTLGTITTGTWRGASISSTYIGNLPSSKITAMTGYSKASASSAIATTNSLNTAIGKLEYKADTNATNITNLQDRAQIFWNTSTDNITGAKTGDFAFIYS